MAKTFRNYAEKQSPFPSSVLITVASPGQPTADFLFQASTCTGSCLKSVTPEGSDGWLWEEVLGTLFC